MGALRRGKGAKPGRPRHRPGPRSAPPTPSALVGGVQRECDPGPHPRCSRRGRARSAGAGLGKSFSLSPCQRRGPCAVVTRSRAPPPPQPGLAGPGRKGRPGPGRGGGGPAGGPGRRPRPLPRPACAPRRQPSPLPRPRLRRPNFPVQPPPPPAAQGHDPCLQLARSLTHCVVRSPPARPPPAGEAGRSEVPWAPLRGRRTGPRDYIGRRLQSRRDTSDSGAPPRAAPGSPPPPAPRSGQGAHGVQPNSRKQGRAPHAPAREGGREELPLPRQRSPISLPPTQK